MGLNEKVEIIGAGTAGLIAAKRLALHGIRTNVYDRKSVLGNQFASGILSIEGLRTLGIDYKHAVTNTFYGARLHAGNETLTIISKKPKAHNIDRMLLARECLDEAETAGANVVIGRQIGKRELEAMHSNGEIIVGADGAVSNVASFFGFPKIGRYVLTYKENYKTKNIEDPRIVDIFFDNDITRGLFGWAVPVDNDTIELGVGLDSGNGNSRTAFDRFVKKKEINDILGRNARRLGGGASIIPIGVRKRFVDEEKRVLLVGDAAGQTKSSTGGGIIFGGNAAIMAADAIRSNIDEGADLENYEKAWRSRYSKEIIAHSIVHSIYSSMSNTQLGMLFAFLRKLGIEGFLAKHGNMDEPTKMIKSLFGRA